MSHTDLSCLTSVAASPSQAWPWDQPDDGSSSGRMPQASSTRMIIRARSAPRGKMPRAQLERFTPPSGDDSSATSPPEEAALSAALRPVPRPQPLTDALLQQHAAHRKPAMHHHHHHHHHTASARAPPDGRDSGGGKPATNSSSSTSLAPGHHDDSFSLRVSMGEPRLFGRSPQCDAHGNPRTRSDDVLAECADWSLAAVTLAVVQPLAQSWLDSIARAALATSVSQFTIASDVPSKRTSVCSHGTSPKASPFSLWEGLQRDASHAHTYDAREVSSTPISPQNDHGPSNQFVLDPAQDAADAERDVNAASDGDELEGDLISPLTASHNTARPGFAYQPASPKAASPLNASLAVGPSV